MAAIHNLRRRLKSVKNTKQITAAMKLVAAAKMKKSQEKVFNARPYARKLQEVLHSVSTGLDDCNNPLLSIKEEKRIKLIVVTADKGLCGGFNASVIKRAFQFIEEHSDKEITLDLVGRKGCDILGKKFSKVDRRFSGIFTKFKTYDAYEIADLLIEDYSTDKFDAIYIIYNEFKSVIQQNLLVEKMFPVVRDDLGAGELLIPHKFEPSAEEIFDTLLPAYIRTQVYRIMIESMAAEFAARMTAMESATKNASEMIEKLTLTMNKIRQAAITTEIIEVVSGGQLND